MPRPQRNKLPRVESEPSFSTLETMAEGELLIAKLRLFLSALGMMIVLVYLGHSAEPLVTTLYWTGGVAACWGALSALYLLVAPHVHYRPWISYVSIIFDLLVVTAAQISNNVAMPFNFANGVMASLYFLVIGLAALRKSRGLVFFAGVGAAIFHLAFISLTYYHYLPSCYAVAAVNGIPMEVSIFDDIIRAVLMVIVAGGFGHVTKELRESERHYHDLFEHVPDGIVIISRAGQVLAVNRQLAAMVGLEAAQIVGRRALDFLRTETMPSPQSPREPGEPIQGSGVLRRPDGADIPVRTVALSAMYRSEPCTEMSVRDVTEQIQLERQLAQSQKMETLGRLAGGLAHDFNNILGGILGATSLVERNIARVQDTIIRDKLNKQSTVIRECAERAREVVSRLMSFSRNKAIEMTPLDLKRLLSDVAMICRNTLGENIEMTLDIKPDLAIVEGDTTSLTQALLNLCINAKDAMPNGGTLTLSLKATDPSHIQLHSHHSNVTLIGPMWCIEVQDTGVGIEQAILDQIFDPFFTTKPVGEGTGLGLSMVYNIAVDHGGFVDVETYLNQGTIFRMYLPLGRASSVPVDQTPLEVLPHGTGRVLVVDDEEIVRSSIGGMLAELGYEVITASGGEEALAIFRASVRRFDLAILDIVMPRMDGTQLLKLLRELDPKLRVLLTSGYWAEDRARPLAELQISGFLKKPFSMADLARAVHKALVRP